MCSRLGNVRNAFMTSPIQLFLAQEGVASEHVRVRWSYNSAVTATVK